MYLFKNISFSNTISIKHKKRIEKSEHNRYMHKQQSCFDSHSEVKYSEFKFSYYQQKLEDYARPSLFLMT